MTRHLEPIRRRVAAMAAAGAVAIALSAGAATSATAAAAGRPGTASAPASAAPATVTLPAPTGHYPLGRTDIELVDHSRPDPWVPADGDRDLMISVWYPTVAGDRHPIAPVMQSRAAAHFGTTDAPSHNFPAGSVDWAATKTHAHLGAPVRSGRWPTVLYSPGLGDPRTWDTGLVEDLASRGYLVVTVDHPHEVSEVEYPDGRLVDNWALLKAFDTTKDPITLLKKILSIRVADSRFVLHTLLSRQQPWSRAIDANRIGMFGHSGGGFEALELIREDPTVKVGADLDGTVGYDESDQGPGLSPLANQGLRRPFLLAGSATNDHYTSTSWAALWKNSRGWHRDLHFTGTEHGSFTDAESYLPQIASRLPAGVLQKEIGWADPTSTVAAQRTYLAAYFDRWLRHGTGGLFDENRPGPYQGVTLVK